MSSMCAKEFLDSNFDEAWQNINFKKYYISISYWLVVNRDKIDIAKVKILKSGMHIQVRTKNYEEPAGVNRICKTYSYIEWSILMSFQSQLMELYIVLMLKPSDKLINHAKTDKECWYLRHLCHINISY